MALDRIERPTLGPDFPEQLQIFEPVSGEKLPVMSVGHKWDHLGDAMKAMGGKRIHERGETVVFRVFARCTGNTTDESGTAGYVDVTNLFEIAEVMYEGDEGE